MLILKIDLPIIDPCFKKALDNEIGLNKEGGFDPTTTNQNYYINLSLHCTSLHKLKTTNLLLN